MRLLLAAWCVGLLWPTFGLATRPESEHAEEQPATSGEVFLDRWQAEAARQWAEQQLAGEPQNPLLHFLNSQALFYLGRYQDAINAVDAAIKLLPHPRFHAARDFMAHTMQSTASLQPIDTAHFRIYLDPERDAALAPYVGEVMERSYERLGSLFELSPTEKVRVEIFPTAATFYPASSLSTRDIEVSGAIGICKFNKIMLLSPRNLTRGYRWTDALSHEYIHYLIVHLSGNNAPIWLHEGIAKYFEDVWRLPQSAWLSRRTESLLAHALRNNSFVGFKNMDPSLVKLDTTYQVQLAYAEAASAIDFILQRLGAPGLVRILRDLAQSQEEGAAAAIARVMGLDFDQFQSQWRQFLSAKPLQEYGDVRLPRFELKEEGKLSNEDINKEIQSAAARMHAHLGDRLRQRGRTQAAAEEYGRALEKDTASPYLLNKLAATWMVQGQWQQALPPLQRAQELDPDYATTYTNLGRLYLAQQAYEQARLALWEAIQINPFDPTIHLYLAESYRQLGQTDKAQQAQQLFERLRETQ